MVIRMLSLPIIGAVEAVVFWFRYRSAVGRCGRTSAFWTFAVCAVRVWFLLAGVSAVMRGHEAWVLIAAYAAPAALVTWGLHRWSKT